MSVIIEVNLHKSLFGRPAETTAVEIFHDGTMEFPEYDIQYDEATVEFGYARTPALRLYQEWQNDPIVVIAYNLFRPDHWKILTMLMTDWAEHVLPLFEEALPELLKKLGYSEYTKPEQPFGPRLAIEMVKDFFINFELSASSRQALQDAEFEAGYWENVSRHQGLNSASEAAATTKYLALSICTQQMRVPWAATGISNHAIEAAKHASGTGSAERAWQIRRFVDIMEAIGLNKPRPPMEATP